MFFLCWLLGGKGGVCGARSKHSFKLFLVPGRPFHQFQLFLINWSYFYAFYHILPVAVIDLSLEFRIPIFCRQAAEQSQPAIFPEEQMCSKCACINEEDIDHTHGIHGTIVYLPTWIVDLYGKLVDKYASPMDIPWNSLNLKGFILQKRLQDTSTDVAEATAGMTLVGGLTSGFGTGIGWLKWLNVWTMQVDHYQSNMTSFENWNLDIVKVFQGVYIP